MIGTIALITLVALILLVKEWPIKKVFEGYNYVEKSNLLSPPELIFFNILRKAVRDNETVFAKVRQADILEVKGEKRGTNFWKAFNKISQKHVDFVICDNKTSKPLIVIELNDKSHLRQDRIIRDTELRDALKKTSIRLVEIPVSSSFTVENIQKSIYENAAGCDDLKQNPAVQKENRSIPASQPYPQQSVDK